MKHPFKGGVKVFLKRFAPTKAGVQARTDFPCWLLIFGAPKRMPKRLRK